jgi:hypothetical protein
LAPFFTCHQFEKPRFGDGLTDGRTGPQPIGTGAAATYHPLTRAPIAPLEDDAAALSEALRAHGPMTQGAAARALGWGATRTWQAEAALRAAGAVHMDGWGRAELVQDMQTNCDIQLLLQNPKVLVGYDAEVV